MYKETIATLNDQNRDLTSRVAELANSNEALEAELERFQMWATEVKGKSAVSHSAENEMSA
jgi:predicted RNase H-like nuclease (RuvC/YqgF family)